MTDKTKRQLRAEAVERLTKLEQSGQSYFPSDVLHAVTPPKEAGIDQLIDILTDDEPTDATCADSASVGEPPEDVRDTREELEAEVRAMEVWRDDGLYVETSGDEIIELLDRQAAITERECRAEAEGGMTNLEWLYEADPFFRGFTRWYVIDGEKADDDIQADEWLMAEHKQGAVEVCQSDGKGEGDGLSGLERETPGGTCGAAGPAAARGK